MSKLDELVRENAEAPDREFLRDSIRAYIEARFGPLMRDATDELMLHDKLCICDRCNSLARAKEE